MSILTLSKDSENYFLSRGYNKELIQSLGIVDILNPKTTFEFLKHNWSIEELIKAGLARFYKERNFHGFAWWQPVIVFPFYNLKNEVIYLQGRHINTENTIKYKNLFSLNKPIYNFQKLKYLKDSESVYFFEGVTDTIMAIQNNYNAFGILGASGFRAAWANSFSKFKINVVPDNDKAGENFAKSIEQSFARIGKEVYIRKLPFGKDFSEYIQLKHQS